MKKTKYFHISEFDRRLEELKGKKVDFEVSSTNYSRKIKLSNKSELFNQDGTQNLPLLSLIHKVRSDGTRFLRSGKRIVPGSYIHYRDLLGPIHKDKVVSKIDIRAAYWECAKRLGVIRTSTDNLYNEIAANMYSTMQLPEEKIYERTKSLRLKALGSLATQRKIVKYEKGKRVADSEEIQTEPTKDIYLDICRNLDNIMQECAAAVDGCIYYYVDCMFVDKERAEEVREFFKSKNFDCGSHDTTLEYVEIGKNIWIISRSDGKMYGVRKESKHLLSNMPL